jgi:hypothetical protein
VRRAGSESETFAIPGILQLVLELHRATRLNDFDLKPHTT